VTPSFEDVLADALVAHDLEGAVGVERVLAAHPEHAGGLRAHIERLRGFGLVERTQVIPPTGPSVEFPEQLGEFRLLHRLGSGGMGVVYLAEQASLRRVVALKLVRSENLFHPGAHERFRREVEAIAKLAHPGIVPVYGAGEDAGIPWLAMEHVEGASLDQVVAHLAGRDPTRLSGADLRRAVTAIVARRAADVPAVAARTATPMPATASEPFEGTWSAACMRIARDVALALQHAHERGVLHRDVKPSNIMLTLDGRALLLDFGLALADGSVRLTGSGTQLGSPAYMSPEQIVGDNTRLDARTDVYSLGVTLYELLTLRMPFAGDSAASTRDLVLAGRPAPLRVLNRTISRDADVVCRKAMDVETGRRYATAAAFASDLDHVLTQHPIQARPPSAFTVARRWAQRHPALTIAAIAGFLLFVVTPTAFLLQQHVANRQITDALLVAKQQRNRAREAVDTMLMRVANETLLEMPRMLALRRELLESARSFYAKFLAESGDDPELRAESAEAATQLAQVELKLGQGESALVAATQAERLFLSVDVRSAQGLAVMRRHNLMVKGSGQHMLSRLPDALATFEQVRRECDAALATAPNDPQTLIEDLSVDRALAIVLSQLQRQGEALACYRRMADTWDLADELTRGTDLHARGVDEMICATADEADQHMQRQDAAAARATLQRGATLAQVAKSERLSYSAQLAIARFALVRARLAGFDLEHDEQEAHYRDALARLRTVLTDFPDYATALRLLATALNDFANCRERNHDADGAMPLYEESIATLRHLIELDRGITENRANLAASLVNVGSHLLDRGEAQPARARFEEAAALAEAALAEAPTRTNWRTVSYNATWFLAQACGRLGDHAAQVTAAERMSELLPDDARTWRIAGGLLMEAIANLAKDANLSTLQRDERQRQLEARAMSMLREAARLGCTDDEILGGEYFAAMRSLPGFAEVVQQMLANRKRAPAGK
jgi:serine/threonine protein kinase